MALLPDRVKVGVSREMDQVGGRHDILCRQATEGIPNL